MGELAAPFRVSLAASSKHLQVLERAGLVQRRIDGRIHTCRLVPEPLARIAEWTESCRELWDTNFRRLDGLLEEMKTEEKDRSRKRKK